MSMSIYIFFFFFLSHSLFVHHKSSSRNHNSVSIECKATRWCCSRELRDKEGRKEQGRRRRKGEETHTHDTRETRKSERENAILLNLGQVLWPASRPIRNPVADDSSSLRLLTHTVRHSEHACVTSTDRSVATGREWGKKQGLRKYPCTLITRLSLFRLARSRKHSITLYIGRDAGETCRIAQDIESHVLV